jgi:hypothetical protein
MSDMLLLTTTPPRTLRGNERHTRLMQGGRR